MYIYKNRGFSLLTTDRVYKDVVCRRKNGISLSHILFPSVYLALALARSLFLSSSHSHITHTVELRITSPHSLNVERSRLYISSLISASRGKSTKDYWYSFCVYACAPFLPPHLSKPSFLSFVSVLLVRCGSALLVNLTLAMTSSY